MSERDHKKDWEWLVACRVAAQVQRLPPGSLPLLNVIGGTEPCRYCDWTEQVAEDGSREGFDGKAIATIHALWPGCTVHMTQLIERKDTRRNTSTSGRLLVFVTPQKERIVLAPKHRPQDVGKPEGGPQ